MRGVCVFTLLLSIREIVWPYLLISLNYLGLKVLGVTELVTLSFNMFFRILVIAWLLQGKSLSIDADMVVICCSLSDAVVAAFAFDSDTRKFGDSRGSRICSFPIMTRPFFLRLFVTFTLFGAALAGSASIKSLIVLYLRTVSSAIVSFIEQPIDCFDLSPLFSSLCVDSFSIERSPLDFDACCFSWLCVRIGVNLMNYFVSRVSWNWSSTCRLNVLDSYRLGLLITFDLVNDLLAVNVSDSLRLNWLEQVLNSPTVGSFLGGKGYDANGYMVGIG